MVLGPEVLDYRLEQLAVQSVTGSSGPFDYPSYASLKNGVATAMQSYDCPSCGGLSVTGSGVVCTYGKVHLYHAKTVPGWLWGTRTKTTFTKTVWRWHEVLVTGSGVMRCRCGWERTAASKKRSCRKCQGAGRMGGKCTVCSGAGEWPCKYEQWETTWFGGQHKAGECVGGHLFKPAYDYSYGICPGCNGRAFVRCSSCAGNGNGESECRTCRGKGETY